MDKELKENTELSHYRIVSKIGAGGMGEVYLAQDTKLDRKVAIKFLHQELSKDADKLGRFIQEAKAASALNHPNILTIHEIGEHDGTNYIVTELIDGKTLRDHLSHKDTLQLSAILKIGVQVSEALSAAHQAGIVHRDIKPENIMIRKDGYAKVLDFGLANMPITNVTPGVKLVAESYNDSWEWALSNNGDIPLLLTPENKSTCAAIPSWMKQLLQRYACFAFSSNACDVRELTKHVPPEWRTVCQLKPKRATYYYAPRWSWPILYFRGSTSDYFRGKKGLDLGARIHYLAGPHRGLEAIANYSRLAETLVPHFEYYSLLGSDMTAIDINAPDPKYKEIQYGDARLLSLASESFHFATIAMILGPANPCATYLEVALSLCELRRVLQTGGLLYIAEVGLQPSVCFAAQCLGFEVFVSRGSPSGLPVGTLLRKGSIEGQPSIFDEIFNAAEVQPVKFHPSHGEVFTNCHLLKDKNKVTVMIEDLAPNLRDTEPSNGNSFAIYDCNETPSAASGSLS